MSESPFTHLRCIRVKSSLQNLVLTHAKILRCRVGLWLWTRLATPTPEAPPQSCLSLRFHPRESRHSERAIPTPNLALRYEFLSNNCRYWHSITCADTLRPRLNLAKLTTNRKAFAIHCFLASSFATRTEKERAKDGKRMRRKLSRSR